MSFTDVAITHAKRIDDLERQLAEKQAEILDYHLQDEASHKAAGEFDKSDSLCTESTLTIIERMKTEIEAMRPVVEECEKYWLVVSSASASWKERSNAIDSLHDILRLHESRKKP